MLIGAITGNQSSISFPQEKIQSELPRLRRAIVRHGGWEAYERG
jgi:hypothetical protein